MEAVRCSLFMGPKSENNINVIGKFPKKFLKKVVALPLSFSG